MEKLKKQPKPLHTQEMDSFLLILLFIIAYVILLFLIRVLGAGEKEKCETCTNCCPDCKSAMERIKRLNGDYVLNYFTFHFFSYKRYHLYKR